MKRLSLVLLALAFTAMLAACASPAGPTRIVPSPAVTPRPTPTPTVRPTATPAPSPTPSPTPTATPKTYTYSTVIDQVATGKFHGNFGKGTCGYDWVTYSASTVFSGVKLAVGDKATVVSSVPCTVNPMQALAVTLST